MRLPRCGRIAYTNDLPVYAGFDFGAVRLPATVVAGVPTQLNDMLLAAELDVSPISSFFYAQHADEFELLDGVCIGSRAAVRSIYLLSGEPLDSLRGVPIAVTRESSTGRSLLDLICRLHHDFAPTFVEADDPFAAFKTGMPALVIGDKAIAAFRATPPQLAYDLGELWHDLSGHAMVYAVWAARAGFAATHADEVRAIADALRESLAWGVANPEQVVAAAQAFAPQPAGFYDDYFRALSFSFDDSAKRGLRLFYELAAQHGMLVNVPELRFVREIDDVRA